MEETLNAMLNADGDRLCRAERYERTEARKDTVLFDSRAEFTPRASPVRSNPSKFQRRSSLRLCPTHCFNRNWAEPYDLSQFRNTFLVAPPPHSQQAAHCD